MMQKHFAPKLATTFQVIRGLLFWVQGSVQPSAVSIVVIRFKTRFLALRPYCENVCRLPLSWTMQKA